MLSSSVAKPMLFPTRCIHTFVFSPPQPRNFRRNGSTISKCHEPFHFLCIHSSNLDKYLSPLNQDRAQEIQRRLLGCETFLQSNKDASSTHILTAQKKIQRAQQQHISLTQHRYTTYSAALASRPAVGRQSSSVLAGISVRN